MYNLELYSHNGSTKLSMIEVSSSVIPRIGEEVCFPDREAPESHSLQIALVRRVTYCVDNDGKQAIYVECVESARPGEEKSDDLIGKRTSLLSDLGWIYIEN